MKGYVKAIKEYFSLVLYAGNLALQFGYSPKGQKWLYQKKPGKLK